MSCFVEGLAVALRALGASYFACSVSTRALITHSLARSLARSLTHSHTFGEHGCTITWQGQHVMLCRGEGLAVALRALGPNYFAWQAQHIVTWRADFVAGAAFGERGCTITWQGQRFMLCRGACRYTARGRGPLFCMAGAAHCDLACRFRGRGSIR